MTFWEFFLLHPLLVAGLVLIPVWGIIELIVMITPTEKDDAAWKRTRKLIFALINLIPRLKKGGGRF